MSDLIERQAAIDVLDVLCQEHRYKIPGKAETYSQYNEAWQDALSRAEGAIFDIPSAQPERIKGRWERKESDLSWWYECSECGESPLYDPYENEVRTPFCPWCGAEMRGESDE